MKKINALQDSIHAEQEQLNKRMDEMNVEMHTYKDLEQVQEMADTPKDYLLQMKKRYTNCKAFMKVETKRNLGFYVGFGGKSSSARACGVLPLRFGLQQREGDRL